jgi:hypothetical protein
VFALMSTSCIFYTPLDSIPTRSWTSDSTKLRVAASRGKGTLRTVPGFSDGAGGRRLT